MGPRYFRADLMASAIKRITKAKKEKAEWGESG
jgi:hypothetical protein